MSWLITSGYVINYASLFPFGEAPRQLHVEQAHKEEAQQLGLVDENSIVCHYWTTVLLDSGETLHIDLNGPSYGVFEYRSFAGGVAPVLLRTAPKESFVCVPMVFKLFPPLTAFLKGSRGFFGFRFGFLLTV